MCWYFLSAWCEVWHASRLLLATGPYCLSKRSPQGRLSSRCTETQKAKGEHKLGRSHHILNPTHPSPTAFVKDHQILKVMYIYMYMPQWLTASPWTSTYNSIPLHINSTRRSRYKCELSPVAWLCSLDCTYSWRALNGDNHFKCAPA